MVREIGVGGGGGGEGGVGKSNIETALVWLVRKLGGEIGIPLYNYAIVIIFVEHRVNKKALCNLGIVPRSFCKDSVAIARYPRRYYGVR